MFLVIFSNRFFPEKVVRIWRELGEDERIALVQNYFSETEEFYQANVFVPKDLPRPSDDKHASFGIPSDPVYAIYADKRGARPKERPVPSSPNGVLLLRMSKRSALTCSAYTKSVMYTRALG